MAVLPRALGRARPANPCSRCEVRWAGATGEGGVSKLGLADVQQDGRKRNERGPRVARHGHADGKEVGRQQVPHGQRAGGRRARGRSGGRGRGHGVRAPKTLLLAEPLLHVDGHGERDAETDNERCVNAQAMMPPSPPRHAR